MRHYPIKRYDDVCGSANDIVGYICRLMGHNYTDDEIYTELSDYHPAKVHDWIVIARLRTEPVVFE